MKCENLRVLLVTILMLAGSIFADASSAAIDPLQPVIVDTIKVNGFWNTQFKRLTEKWLPHCIKQMEPGGRGQELLNLINTAKALKDQSHGKYTGLPWSDAYVYNTMEAICLALAIDPQDDVSLVQAQQFLRSKVEEWIPIILNAQMESGYIHSYHTVNGHPHYSRIGAHEFYVMGYFLEMGVAHYRLTGGQDRRLYEAARRCADHLDATFGPAPKRTWKNGHAGLEYALCRLARLVNTVEEPGQGDKYTQLAKYFLDHQHEIEANEYNQSHKPAIEMSEAKGHAVRATYFYTAMADMVLLAQDRDYLRAVDKIWANAIQRKHYITGGVGASHRGEAFAEDFDLRNDGYCESCAGCGLSFWADRMSQLHHHAHYHDVLERTLYNNILGAMELSGENFFYQNPLASDGARHPWHGCPCCVGNIPRSLFALKDLFLSTNTQRDTLLVNHFMDCDVTLSDFAGTRLRLRQKTKYPWQGKVTLSLFPDRPLDMNLKLRIPDRTESDLYTVKPDRSGQFTLRLNGQVQKRKTEQGYLGIRRRWRKGDSVQLSLPMDVQRVYCDERVEANRGRVALMRGPLAYNIEAVDHQVSVHELVLPPDATLEAAWKPELLEGIMAISGHDIKNNPIMAVPNFVRLNRGGYSQVWLVEDPDRVVTPAMPGEPIRKVKPLARSDLDPRTLDRVIIADTESEKAHQVRGERTGAGAFRNRHWRHAGNGWFSYRLKVKPNTDNSLLCTYWGSDTGNRRFDILIDGTKIAHQILNNNQPGEFFDVTYTIPAELTQNKETVTVRFQSLDHATAGGVFDLRTLTSTTHVQPR